MVRDIVDDPLDEDDIALVKTYGLVPYSAPIKKVEKEIKELTEKINDLCGIKESDTGLAPLSKQMMQEGQPLQVGYVSCFRYIPIDLLMDIFSRVPAKSIARFRCVSKLWESILCRPDFKELFMTMSSIRPPLLLFTFQDDDGNLFFFSSPHPQIPCNENTSLVPTRYHVQHTTDSFSEIGSPLCGFICRRGKRNLDTMVICNPVTGESVSLPKVELKSINTETRPYLGYDPVRKQLKVLCIKSDDIPNTCDEHQVLTLENGNHLWRTIQCKPHYPKSDGICIDGILYYTAGFDMRARVSMVVCFDVRSEKFSFINIHVFMLMNDSCTLINYKGKLGALQFTCLSPKRLRFWVLVNAEKNIWTKCIYALPPLWNNLVQHTELAIVGMTDGGEVVLSQYCLIYAFYIYYFNLESKSLTRVQIQDVEMFKRTRVYTSLGVVENFKLMTDYDRGFNTFSPQGRLF
jgi:F-box interacting protein